jgi:hypothetical protein
VYCLESPKIFTVVVESWKNGASLTGVTITVKLMGFEVFTPPNSVPPSSTAVTLSKTEPYTSPVGLNTRVPENPDTDISTLGPFAKVTLPEKGVNTNERFCEDSSGAPRQIDTIALFLRSHESSSTVMVEIGIKKEGGSLTGRTIS